MQSFKGRSDKEFFGASICVLRNTGSLIPDYAIGAYNELGSSGLLKLMDPSGLTAGKIDVVSGESRKIRAELREQDRDLTLGASVANVGDVDGDGYDDLVAGVADHSGGIGGALFNHSCAKVYSGATGKLLFKIDVESGDSVRVCALGDVDKDGTPDFACLSVGAPSVLTVVSTKARKPLRTIRAEDKEAWESLALVGDLDGDKVQDLAVGSRDFTLNKHPVGVVRIFSPISGKQVGGGLGDSTWSRIGLTVCRISDFDGDGVDDLAVGGCRDEGGGTDNVVAVRSGRDWHLIELLDFGDGPLGEITSLAPLPDLDGDGKNELIVCAANCSSSHGSEDCCHVVSTGKKTSLAAFEGRIAVVANQNEEHGAITVLASSPFSGQGGEYRGAVRLYELLRDK